MAHIEKTRWAVMRPLLDQLLDLEADARVARLEEIRRDDHLLASELETLLAQQTLADREGFLLQSLPQEMAGLEEDLSLKGQTIGGYTLDRPIGQGGMGSVWLANRSDGRYEGKAAVKFLNLALMAHGGTERFKREGNFLARLAHPHIARLIDAGVASGGQPYLVLEYVEGEAIDRWCDAKALSVEARVRLFLDVLAAVAHAHNNLILHRDLKSSNILVTSDGDVKLLDFGIAKLLGDDLSAGQATELTQLAGGAFTPEFAAPEQVQGLDVSTATDVYALGVLLYVLLSGQHPTSANTKTPVERLQAVVNTEPVRLSSSVTSHSASASALAAIANKRAATPLKLARALQGDLENIVAKALKKNPADRYANAAAMADDIRRYLNQEPVLARPDAFSYRVSKFVRRNRLAVAASTMVIAAIGAGAIAALWQARVARAEAMRAEQVKQFIASIFTQAAPRQGIGGAVTAGDLLTAAAQRIEKELADRPREAAELGVMIGTSFSALGEPQKGTVPLRAAVARAEKEFGRQHPITLQGKWLLVESIDNSDLATSERLLAELIPDALAGLPATAEVAVRVLRSHSFVLAKRNQANESYAALNQAIAVGEQYLSAQHTETISALGLLSNTFARFGERDRQLTSATEAMRRAEIAFSTSRPHVMLTSVERWYADALRANDRPREAVPILRRVLSDQRALDVVETPRVRNARSQLALALDAMGRTNEALPLMREAVSMEERQNQTETDDRIGLAANLTGILVTARRADEALALSDRTEAISRRLGNEPETRAIGHGIRRARILAQRGDHEQATQTAEAAAQRAGDKRRQQRAEAWLAAAFSARMQGKDSDAIEFAQRVQSDSEAKTFRLNVQAATASELGNAWLNQRDVVQAERVLMQARELYARAQIEPSINMSDCIVGLARIHLHAGRAAEAEAMLVPLEAAWSEINPDSEWQGETLYWLSRARAESGKTEEARADRKSAIAMLKKSTLPVHLRLIAPK
jgi:serine/threonine protein kinase